MATHLEAINRLGGAHELARLLAVKPVTARAWVIRGNIPARYWPDVERVSTERGDPITISELAVAAARAA